MAVFAVRVTLFTLLPVMAATILTVLDRGTTTRSQRIELYLVYLFGLGVAGSGIGGAIGHLFLSDTVARSVGWPTGSPFQLEMGFANLALGVLGLVATGRRDGFREATVLSVTIIGLGATIVHLLDIVHTGNLAPGNTLQNVANLARPALLVGFLRASRAAEAAGEGLGRTDHSKWRGRHNMAVGCLTAMVSTGFAVGFALDRPVLGAAAGVAAGALCVWGLLRRRADSGQRQAR